MARNTGEQKTKYNKEDAYKSLEMVNAWIGNIDTKASFLLAYIAILMGFIISNGIPAIYDASVKLTFIVLVERVVDCLMYFSSGCCVLFLFLSLKARVKNMNTKKSLLFFGHISTFSVSDFTSKVSNRSEESQVKDILEQVHTNSIICTKKAKMYNVAVVFAIISTMLLFVCFTFGMI